jgi:hypothetical protein
MFARIANFRVAGARHAAPSSAAAVRANDNWAIACVAGSPPRTRRPELACRSRPMTGSGFECCWTIELADSAATGEPIPSRSKFDDNLP